MRKFNFGTAALSAVLLLSVMLAALLPGSPAKADEGNAFSKFFDADGNLLPGVQSVPVTQTVSWMPSFPAWVPFQPQAVYTQVVAPDGATMLMPSMTTLFFMVLAVVWITGWDTAEREAVERSREPGEHQCPFCGAPAVGQTFLGYVCREHGGE